MGTRAISLEDVCGGLEERVSKPLSKRVAGMRNIKQLPMLIKTSRLNSVKSSAEEQTLYAIIISLCGILNGYDMISGVVFFLRS